MAIRFQIPRVLEGACEGRMELTLRGATVREVLAEVRREYPDLYRCICHETGSVRQHINLFVNNSYLKDRQGLDTRLEPGDVVSVFQAVSGG